MKKLQPVKKWGGATEQQEVQEKNQNQNLSLRKQQLNPVLKEM